MVKFEVFTLFPDMFEASFKDGVISRAVQDEIISINLHNWRRYSTDNYKTVDDYQYGGGPGMILKPEPLFKSVESIITNKNVPIILLSPQGKKFDQKKAIQLSNYSQIALICGRYGGFDERTYRGAAVVELIHTATLVHDDVVDDSNMRRDFFSINALWKNKISVLVGDFMLSKGLLLSIDNNDFDLLKQ